MSDDKKKKGGGDEGGKEAQAPKVKPQLDEAQQEAAAKKRAERAAKKAGKGAGAAAAEAEDRGAVVKPAPARLRVLCEKELAAQIQKGLRLTNNLEVPRMRKITINMGLGDGISDPKSLA